MSIEKLKEAVLEVSCSKNWDEARQEWELLTIYHYPNHCQCGHHIEENCVIHNEKNGNELVVGNVCVNKFGVDRLNVSTNSFNSLKRITEKTRTSSVTEELLNIAFNLGIVSQSEVNSYEWARSLRRDSAEEVRYKINNLLKLGFCVDRPRCTACQGNPFLKPRMNRYNKTFFYSCPNWPKCNVSKPAPLI